MMVPEISSDEFSIKAHRRRFSGKFLVFTVFLLLFVGYSGFWYYMAGRVEAQVRQSQEKIQDSGMTVDCGNLGKTGYPLRIAIACNSLIWQQASTGLRFTGSRLVAGAPVYAPHWISFDITAPVTLDLPGAKPLEGQWEAMRLEADINKKQPGRLVLTVDEPQITMPLPAGPEKLLSAEFIRLDADRQNDTLALQLSFDKMLLPWVGAAAGKNISPLSGNIVLSLDDADRFYRSFSGKGGLDQLKGHSGTVSKAVFSPEKGGKLTISGPFSISQEGLLNGRFTIAVADAAALKLTINDLFPEQAGNLDTILFALASMPKNERGEPQLVIAVVDGQARAGFIKIGKIPPIGDRHE